MTRDKRVFREDDNNVCYRKCARGLQSETIQSAKRAPTGGLIVIRPPPDACVKNTDTTALSWPEQQ